jgi:ubiquitin-conjugating enzyme E2 Z
MLYMASLNKETLVVTRDTIKRLAKDVKDIIKNPLTDNGIYYAHDENNILKGYAMIVGPPDTPYAGGYYFFMFQYPHDYPFKPPVVTYHTNDGVTRFNPNLYRCGKVCISILNTWKGPQWTSCQSITSVLLCLCGSVLNDNPLLNEPGVTKTHRDFSNYLEILKYKNFDVAIGDMLTSEYIQVNFTTLYIEMVKHFLHNYDNINDKLTASQCDNQKIIINLYKMHADINYDKTRKKLANTYRELKN